LPYAQPENDDKPKGNPMRYAAISSVVFSPDLVNPSLLLVLSVCLHLLRENLVIEIDKGNGRECDKTNCGE